MQLPLIKEASTFFAVDDSKTNITKQSPLIAALSSRHRIHTHSSIGSFLVLLLHVINRKQSSFAHYVFGQEEENVAPLACVCLCAP